MRATRLLQRVARLGRVGVDRHDLNLVLKILITRETAVCITQIQIDFSD